MTPDKTTMKSTSTHFYNRIKHLFPTHLLYWAYDLESWIPYPRSQLLQSLVCRFWWMPFCHSALLTDSRKTRPIHRSFSRSTYQTGLSGLEGNRTKLITRTTADKWHYYTLYSLSRFPYSSWAKLWYNFLLNAINSCCKLKALVVSFFRTLYNRRI